MSGTVNIVDTSALATVAAQTDGSQKAQVHGPAKGSTVAADATVRTVDADHNALDVSVNGTVALAAGSAVIGHVITDTGSTTAVSSLPAIPTGSNTIGAVTAPGAAALALDATLTGGTTKAIARGGAKGSTVAADVTSTSIDADHTALDVSVKGAVTISGAVTVTSGAMTETNSGTIATNTGTAATNTSTIAGAVNSGAMVVKGGGAAGTAASAVVTVQGIAAMTPVQIGDNSGSLTVDAPVATPVFVRLSDGASAVAPATSAQLPASLGQAARASSLTVALSTEDAAKVPALGQALAASSVPVVLTAIQIAQLAQDATLTGGTQIAIAKGAAATGAAVSGNPVYVGGKDGSGNAQPLLVNASGVLQTSMAKGTSVSSTAAEASRVISASACLVSRISMQNGNGATRYCQAHNATSLPSNGAVPVAVIIIGTTQTQVMSFSIPTDKFSTGCVVATSTTGPTLTIGSSDATFGVDLFPTNV